MAHASNAGARLAGEMESGPVVEPSDDAGIEAAIEGLYKRWLAGDLDSGAAERRAEALRRFSRDKLTAELARVLEKAAG